MEDISVSGAMGLTISPAPYNSIRCDASISGTVGQLITEEGKAKIREAFSVIWEMAEDQMSTQLRDQVKEVKKILEEKGK